MSELRFQGTPNPNAIKVLMPRAVVDGSLVVATPEDAEGHPMAAELLALEGVTDLYLLNDFVTVSKEADVDWDDLLPEVERVVGEHVAGEHLD